MGPHSYAPHLFLITLMALKRTSTLSTTYTSPQNLPRHHMGPHAYAPHLFLTTLMTLETLLCRQLVPHHKTFPSGPHEEMIKFP